MSTRYEQGRGFAYRVSRKLADDGYEVIRSAGSKTKVDFVAFKAARSWKPKGVSVGDGFDNVIYTMPNAELLFVQAKKADGTIPPAERAELIRLAKIANATPIVAYQAKPRGPIVYRRLTGPGPKDWQPWTPDWAVTP